MRAIEAVRGRGPLGYSSKDFLPTHSLSCTTPTKLCEMQESTSSDSRRSRAVKGALFGAAAACALICIAFSFSAWSEGKNEGNSGLFSAIVWGLLVPLAIVTFAPLWMEHVHLWFVAAPWHLVLNQVIPSQLSIAVGFILNCACLGAIAGYLRRSSPRSIAT